MQLSHFDTQARRFSEPAVLSLCARWTFWDLRHGNLSVMVIFVQLVTEEMAFCLNVM